MGFATRLMRAYRYGVWLEQVLEPILEQAMAKWRTAAVLVRLSNHALERMFPRPSGKKEHSEGNLALL